MSRRGVREAVAGCLEVVLTAGSVEARRDAEQEMKALEVTEEYGLVLAELAASVEVGVAYRQLAGVLLRQYLDSHWCQLAENFSEPVPGSQVKQEIRELLLATLGDRQRKLRATVAYCVAVIAHWDWPEAWPQLLPRLDAALSSGDGSLVHGAMRVLTEFCRDLSDLQLPGVAPVILPQLVRVLLQPQVFGVRTQSRAVHIFHTLASIVYTASEATPTLMTSIFLPVLPKFVEVIISLLSSGERWASDHGLRRELLMTSSSLLRWFPATMATYVMDLVTPVWKIFLSNTPLTSYVAGVVNCEGVRGEECDSDGELVTMETCVFAVFEFISGLIESRELQGLLPPILPTLILHLISHMQPTHTQVECWLADVAEFVDEEEQVFSYSVRLSAHDLLMMMWEEPTLRDHTHSAITAAVEKHLQSSRGLANAWKMQEACLLALSCIATTESGSFSAQQFTKNVVMPTLQCPSGHPLLLGRCLWLAGKMAAQLKLETIQQLLQSLVAALLPSQHPVLRVLAAKASYYFCSELKGSASPLQSVLSSLISILASMTEDSPDIVLLVVIDTLQLVASVDEAVTARHAQQLSEVALSLFLKHSHDPGLSSSLEDLFSVLAANSGCHANLHRCFLPSAVQVLETSETGLALALVPAVLEVLVLLVRGCGEGKVPAEVVKEIFPRVIRVGVASDDISVIQNAGECIRSFVAMAMEQLVQWRDSEGESGVMYVVRLAVHMLDPSQPESSAAFIGRLLIVLFRKAGAVLGESLQLLLRSVLSKMQSVRTASVMQSLLVVYAFLLHTEMEAVISFLCQVPDPRGQPALNYVLQEWTSQHPFFFGSYDTRISTVALCQLLSHCVSTGNQLLCGLLIEEEEEDGAAGVKTRSQKAASGSLGRRVVPLPVKVVSLLLGDLQSHLEASAASAEGSEGNSEDGDMEALLRAGEMWEEPEDDPDLHGDPLLQLDMQAHLVKFLRELSQLSFFSSSVQPHLRPSDLLTLKAALN